MTRKDILRKYGYCWMSNVDLREELSEQAAAEFEDLIRILSDHNRGPTPLWHVEQFRKIEEKYKE